MKRILLALILAFAPLVPLALTTGCNTTQSAQGIAYKTLRSTWLSVDAAMQVANELYQAGKLTPAQRLEIIAAHDKYRVSMDTAISAASLNWDSATPADVSTLARDVITLISLFTNAS